MPEVHGGLSAVRRLEIQEEAREETERPRQDAGG